MSKIKLIAFDLDGTLTQHKTPLDPKNRAILEKLLKKYRYDMFAGGRVYLGMYDVYAAVECRRLSEKDEFRVGFQLLVHPFYALEEYHLHLAAAVRNPCAHTAYCVEFQIVLCLDCICGRSVTV